MVRMRTPYGTTQFELSPLSLQWYGMARFIEVTDPHGNKERVEHNTGSNETGVPGPLEMPRPDPSAVNFSVGGIDDRNTFYWDKQRMALAPGDYSKAHLYHWLQPYSGGDVSTGVIESEKPPLEGRIWYNYPGQPSPSHLGTLAKPSVVARMVDDTGTFVTQASSYAYNEQGNVTEMTDPLGRTSVLEYASNGIDVTAVKQKVGAGFETLVSFTYDPSDPPHLPRTVTDGAGQTTTYAYNASGQVTQVTNPLGEVVVFTYEANPLANGFGHLKSVTGDVSGGDVSLTYDSFNRVRTATTTD